MRPTWLITRCTARVDRARSKRDAPTPSVAPNDDALRRLFAVVVRGLPVSLRSFFQNVHVESLFGHHLFQPRILFLEGLKLLRHLRLPVGAELMDTLIIEGAGWVCKTGYNVIVGTGQYVIGKVCNSGVYRVEGLAGLLRGYGEDNVRYLRWVEIIKGDKGRIESTQRCCLQHANCCTEGRRHLA